MTTATVTNPDLELKYADKIAKLLNQAESTDNPAEAEAFMEKAAQLMVEYAIDEAMVAAARGLQVDELVQDTFNYSGIYRNAHQELAAIVAKHFGLRIVYGHDRGKSPIVKPLYLAGFRSDVERARLLDTSLQLQAASAHRAWWKENRERCAWMDKGMSFRTRRDFLFGFGTGVEVKLAMARRAAQAEAVKHEAERAGAEETEAKKSVELVLVNRKERVDEFYDSVWGGRTRSVNHRYGAGGAGANTAGFNAGRNANTNTGANSIRGNRGAIGS